MDFRPGRHFLQIPGPSPVPDRVLRAMNRAVVDHRGPEFAELGLNVLRDIKPVFGTKNHVIIFPSSGTGAWEAALVNTLSSGDKVLMFETGQFASLWLELAGKLGIEVDFVEGDWRSGVNADQVEEKLRADINHTYKAICIVHNETSTGVTSNVPNVRAAMDAARHPALLMVDTISSLGSVPYHHDAWGVDVTVSGSQKGLMLPPGLGFNAISNKALQVSKSNGLARSYWDWQAMIANNESGYFPYTPATNLLYGLQESLTMLSEEGLDKVFSRHDRMAEATRRAVQAWGLEVLCNNPDEYSSVLTGVMMPDGVDADEVRKVILDNFDMSLGTGLGKMKGRIFRIGHLGEINELTLIGALAGVEMGLSLADVPHQKGGVAQAMSYLTATVVG
ncbi:MAG: serine--glyoxylate aminotransferase [Magnetovibrio sp.]|nr:serine--glyoxylate aminotransferase [Magnetovibrio sp.]